MFLNNQRYYSANTFFKEKFGTKVIKIALDGGFNCPNRDGTLSEKGCIFCSEKGSGDFAGERTKTISNQFEQMKRKMSEKWKDGSYMVYFQAFTNTYAPVEELRLKYYEAISQENVIALSIATRPDCINQDIINLLKEISKEVYVCIELGFQTSKKESIDLINRCYDNDVFISAMKLLTSNNIDVICHVILGLPYETKEDMLNTVRFVADNNISGIKLQLLHIIKNTPLEQYYNDTSFKVLTLEEYVDIIVNCIEILPKNIVVHRITGDGSKVNLVEPKWSLNKKKVLNMINKELIVRNIYQGEKNSI